MSRTLCEKNFTSMNSFAIDDSIKTHTLPVIAMIVLVLNLPFGFFRAGVKKFSLPWFVAVHSPVPIVIGLRFLSGLGWYFITFPVLIGAFLSGQYFGGKLFLWRYKR